MDEDESVVESAISSIMEGYRHSLQESGRIPTPEAQPPVAIGCESSKMSNENALPAADQSAQEKFRPASLSGLKLWTVIIALLLCVFCIALVRCCSGEYLSWESSITSPPSD